MRVLSCRWQLQPHCQEKLGCSSSNCEQYERVNGITKRKEKVIFAVVEQLLKQLQRKPRKKSEASTGPS